MVSRIQINFREDSGTVQVMDEVISSRCNMPFTKNRTIWLAHIDTRADFIRVLWFQCDNKRGHPRGWAVNRFNNSLAFESVKFGVELFAKIERDSPMRLRHGGYRRIDM